MTEGYERGRVFNLTLLAHGHAHRGTVDQACAVGKDVAAAAAGMNSHRVVKHLRDFRRALAPAEGSPALAPSVVTRQPLGNARQRAPRELCLLVQGGAARRAAAPRVLASPSPEPAAVMSRGSLGRRSASSLDLRYAGIISDSACRRARAGTCHESGASRTWATVDELADSGSGLEDEVDRRFACNPNAAEAGVAQPVGEDGRTGLRSQRSCSRLGE